MNKRVKVSPKRQEKYRRWQKLWKFLDTYEQILIVDCDNVSSQQMMDIRRAIRPLGAELFKGKNTQIKAGLNRRMKKPNPEDEDYELRKDTWRPPKYDLEKLISLVRFNSALIFVKGSTSDIKDIIVQNKRSAAAKTGTIAPSTVVIHPGPTGLDPKQTEFFQRLGIATKLVKQQVEITQEVTIVGEGEKVMDSVVVLLEKLSIRPFSYQMKIKSVFDKGQVFPAAVLDITDADLLSTFSRGASLLAAASLSAGYPTAASIPHSIINGFKKLVAATIENDYTFEAGAKLKEMAKDPSKFAVAAAPAAAQDEKKEEEPEKQDEEDDVEIAGIFGDDDDDY